LSIYEKILPESPETITSLNNLGLLLLDVQKCTEAGELGEKVRKTSLRGFTGMLSFTSERERLLYANTHHPYALLGSASNAVPLALAILQNKGLVLDSLLEDRLVTEASDKPEERAVINQLDAAKDRLTQLLLSPASNSGKEALKKQAEARSKAWQEVEQLEGDMARKVAGAGRVRQALSVTLEKVQAAIPPQTVLIEFLRYPHYLGKNQWASYYGAAVLAPQGEPRWVCLGSAQALEFDITLYLDAVYRAKDRRDFSKLLADLGERVWMPLEPLVPAGTKTIILSPDGGLNLISFAALLIPKDQFLGEKYIVRYVASGRDLLREARPCPNSELVVFANPDYGEHDHSGPGKSGGIVSPLPRSAQEAAVLRGYAKKWKWPVRVYTGLEATEERVRTLDSPRILHFSTHGFSGSGSLGNLDAFSLSGFTSDLKSPIPTG
jgi:hypothetical protein